MFKALIVDDEPQIRTGMRTIVPWESYGFAIAGEAADGVDALEAIREHTPDLVITDVKMPRMSGIELAHELRAQSPETEIVVLSGYNEFAYAKEALRAGVADYLLKPVDPDELGGCLSNAYERLWNRLQTRMKEREKADALQGVFLNRLIRGEVHRDVVRMADTYGIDIRGRAFRMLLVSIDAYGQFLLSLPGGEIGWKRFAMGNVIRELLPDDALLFDITEQQFGIVLRGADCADAAAARMAGQIADSMLRYVKEQVTIGIGAAVETPEQLPHACRTAHKALEMKFYRDAERVLLYEPQDDAATLVLAWDDQPLCAAIREGAPDKIAAEVEQLLLALDGRNVPLAALKAAVMATIIRLAKMTEEFHGEWPAMYTGRFQELEHIVANGRVKQLHELLIAIARQIGDHIRTVSNRKMDSRIDEIVEHIGRHYRSDLNLKELSRLFYINTVYLGQLFKKETGQYFNDYVNQVRIGHAVRLLKETNWSAAEIAEAVGYKYVDHFYRQFKQLEGMTPGEYRRHHSLI